MSEHDASAESDQLVEAEAKTNGDAPTQSIACVEGELIPARRKRGRLLGYRQPDRMRARIQTGALITRLHGITKGRVDGTPAHLAVQVQAAKVLLAKALPDLQSVTIAGDAAAPLVILTRME
jgi:hypothetical protein